MKDIEHFDVIIEQLPWHLRNKVLDRLDDDGEFKEVDERSRKQIVKSYSKGLRLLWWLLLPIVWAWATVLILFSCLIIFIPVFAIPCAYLGGMPAALHMAWRVKMGVTDDED